MGSVKRRSLRGVVVGVVRASEEVAEAAAVQLAALMRRDVRVRTGYTRSTIRTERAGKSRRVLAGGASLFLEYGTSRMAARPFVRPNLKEVRKLIRALGKKALAANLRGGLK